eukprot:TRINITY_DN5386_c0_g1_i12.p1 TRINITY_DN5386_c0_g1~~TRINITY_DN5386_c0_g1_i12.p1  ORF type:complete len:341 (-),score=60.22 TRINITY_DN5386_c0_g1_i12:175-1197(-)
MDYHCAPFTKNDYEDLCKVVWPHEYGWSEEILWTLDNFDTWTAQGFEFSNVVPLGLRQNKNGPCGVLAVVQAFLLKDLIFLQGEWVSSHQYPPREAIASSLSRVLEEILIRSRLDLGHASDGYKIVLPADPSSILLSSYESFLIHHVPRHQLLDFVRENLCQFQAPGGLVLFVYSLILTRGVQQVILDSTMDSLIVGEWGLCTQALVNLCLLGVALPGVDDDTIIRYFNDNFDIGLLTYEEVENITFGSGYSVISEKFKHPTFPIWILHGGDHYTTLFGFSAEVLKHGIARNVGGGGTNVSSGMCVNNCGFHGSVVTFGYCSSCYTSVGSSGINAEYGEE